MSEENVSRETDVSKQTETEVVDTPDYKKDSGSLKFETVPVNPFAPEAHQNAQTIAMASDAMKPGQQQLEQAQEKEEKEQEQPPNIEDSEQNSSDEPSTPEPKKRRTLEDLNRLAKEKSEARRREQEYKKRIEELESSKETGLNPDELRKLALEDPIEFTKKVGIEPQEFYNKFTDRVLKGDETQEQTYIKKLEAEVESLKEKFETREKTEAEKEVERQTTQFKNQIKSHIEKDPEKYELIQMTDSVNTVYEVILQYFNQTKQLLNLDEAATIVENQLEEDLSSRLQNLAKAKKMQKLGIFQASEQKPDQEVTQPSSTTEKTNTTQPSQVDPVENFAKERKMNRTITNQMVGQSTIGNRPMSREDRMREAAKMLKNAQG